MRTYNVALEDCAGIRSEQLVIHSDCSGSKTRDNLLAFEAKVLELSPAMPIRRLSRQIGNE